MVSTVGRSIGHNGLGLGEVGEIEAQMFNKPQMLIEVQMFNLALLPPFCQTPVSGSFYSSACFIVPFKFTNCPFGNVTFEYTISFS